MLEQMNRVINLKIAGIGIRTELDESCEEWFSLNNYKIFFTEKMIPEVHIRVYYGVHFPYMIEETLFIAEPIWTLHSGNGNKIICLPSLSGDRTGMMKGTVKAAFKTDFSLGNVYIPREEKTELAGPNVPYYNPLKYPLDYLLLLNLLSLGRGILIHACGIRYNDRGFLFVGHSGAGKSTIANMTQDSTVLSDDRVIIKKKDNCFWLYGTPWPGTGRHISPEGAPLKKIFFLKQSPVNKVTLLENASQMLSALFVCSFPPFWDRCGLEYTLNFCKNLAGQIPCYDLEFTLSEDTVNFLGDLLKNK
jgi:hypothetical protein